MVARRIVEAFANVSDPRVERTQRHRVVDILVIALLAVINGSTGWVDRGLFARGRLPWLRTFLARFSRIWSPTFVDGSSLSMARPCAVRWIGGEARAPCMWSVLG